MRVRYRPTDPALSALLGVVGAICTWPSGLLLIGIPFAPTPFGIRRGWVE